MTASRYLEGCPAVLLIRFNNDEAAERAYKALRLLEDAAGGVNPSSAAAYWSASQEPATHAEVLTDEPLTDRELQTLRNLGNEAERAADEIVSLRAAIATQAAQQPKDLGDALTGPGSPLQPQAASTSIPIAACKVGDYVLATKYSDGDPGDRWAVGFYAGMGHDLHMVNDSAGKQIHAGGYRCVIRIPFDVGAWLLKNAHVLESSPPGAVNLLQMVATEFNADRIEEEQE